MNLDTGEEATACSVVMDGADHVAVVGDNRKLLIFPIEEMPVMARGRGVILQRYKSGGLSDVTTLKLKEGLTWQTAQTARNEPKVKPWLGKRAQAGLLPFKGFPTSKKFGG